MKKLDRKTLLGFLISFLAIGASIFVLISAGVISLPGRNQKTPQETVVEEADELEALKKEYRQIYDENKAINEDYVGEIIFDSGLIRVSFVQAKSCYKEDGELYQFYTEDGKLVTDASDYTGNDVYIWTYWKTGEYDYNDNGGSTFMDYRNNLADQNLIVYGHHFSVWNDETRSKAFTPLEQLLEEENYPDNRYVTLVLQNEIRKYEIVSVYEFNATREEDFTDLQYWRTNYNYDDYDGNAYDPDYYRNYIANIRKAQLYDTGIALSEEDQTLTLQTCIGGHAGELFEIVVLKQISSTSY
ncbi:MAG: class B sortase [Erysipelotrichaceae bacterium]|nr:class B sortase [Erysipelotrichaceae bacterium]